MKCLPWQQCLFFTLSFIVFFLTRLHLEFIAHHEALPHAPQFTSHHYPRSMLHSSQTTDAQFELPFQHATETRRITSSPNR